MNLNNNNYNFFRYLLIYLSRYLDQELDCQGTFSIFWVKLQPCTTSLVTQRSR